jgi:hypothetical protein
MPINDEILKLYMDLFKGRTDRYGTIVPGKKPGELEGLSVVSPVTKQTYINHLDGKTSLGVYMMLDDGTVNFAVLDLDWHVPAKDGPPDFKIALKVREALAEQNLPAYIANSKSGLGFHIYVFFSAPTLAADVRKILLAIIKQIDVKNAEIFPKQDKVGGTTPYGNYINLPYFGDSQRKFLNTKQETLNIDMALPKIKRIGPKDITELSQKVIYQNTIADAEKYLKTSTTKLKKVGKYPPCIGIILKGVPQGIRDIAAFTLASHYLTDQGLGPDETLVYLEKWNSRNSPPLSQKELQEKIKSAGKGYDVGCNKIKNEPALASMCVGDLNCEYIQKINQEKIKNGQILITSFFETDTHLYEQIIKENKPLFAAYEKATGSLLPVDRFDTQDGITVIPYPVEKDGELYQSRTVLPVITLPTGVLEYGSEENLVRAIHEHITLYCDLPEEDIKFGTYYILSTWVYDKLNTLSYLRFQGSVGSGKSTCLDVIGKLCYKPMMAAGAVTAAPIFRIIRKFGGTLILDESDMRYSSMQDDITKCLNCGIQRGRQVIRCLQDDAQKLVTSPVYCPKVFSSRQSFEDMALESRCFTIMTEPTDKKLPIADGKSFLRRMEEIRNQLLVWRFRRYDTINGEDAINIDLGMLEPRLRQISRPFALTFKDNATMMSDFRDWLKEKQREQIDLKNEDVRGHIIHAIFDLAVSLGRYYVSSSAIAKILKENYKSDFNPRTVGKILAELKIKTKVTRVGAKSPRCIIWDIKRMKRLLNTYFLPEDITDEYQKLLIPGEQEPIRLNKDNEIEV